MSTFGLTAVNGLPTTRVFRGQDGAVCVSTSLRLTVFNSAQQDNLVRLESYKYSLKTNLREQKILERSRRRTMEKICGYVEVFSSVNRPPTVTEKEQYVKTLKNVDRIVERLEELKDEEEFLQSEINVMVLRDQAWSL
ncbi:hypothetical protein MMC19_006807 [Ptychographa xylographoides]|nr:hypothetical protein [Ptychographa xylographoides]